MPTVEVREDFLALVVVMAEKYWAEHGTKAPEALSAMRLEAIRDTCRVLGRWSVLDG